MGEANGRGTREERVGEAVGMPHQAALPQCQYCGLDPCPVQPVFADISGAKAVILMCPGCRAIHGAQIMATPGPPQRGIVVPGR
jgi:hypothetical protein